MPLVAYESQPIYTPLVVGVHGFHVAIHVIVRVSAEPVLPQMVPLVVVLLPVVVAILPEDVPISPWLKKIMDVLYLMIKLILMRAHKFLSTSMARTHRVLL